VGELKGKECATNQGKNNFQEKTSKELPTGIAKNQYDQIGFIKLRRNFA
jgi:hypothetical protein